MCGRYYIDGEMKREIDGLLRQMDSGKTAGVFIGSSNDNRGELPEEKTMDWRYGDIYPSEMAPVIAAGGSDGGSGSRKTGIHVEWQRWGLPGFSKNRVIFNARSETVLEKTMFRDGIVHRRVVIPARWFYEWNRAKEKITFFREEAPVLYMAGFYNVYEDGPHFVILTTNANESMKAVHSRMPLILEKEELVSWLTDETVAGERLKQVPVLLAKQAEYEQTSFWFEESRTVE